MSFVRDMHSMQFVFELPEKSNYRSTISFSKEGSSRLNLLKAWSGSKNRDIVVEDAINTLYELVLLRDQIARNADLGKRYEKCKTEEESVMPILTYLDEERPGKYWKGKVKIP
jgi:hypothetical protein